MAEPITAKAVFDAIFAGTPAAEIEVLLQSLTEEERQVVVCTACYVLNEIAANCQQRAAEVSQVVALHCHRYAQLQETCFQIDDGEEPPNG